MVLETTGLADPGPLLHTVGSEARLASGLRLGAVLAVVDSRRIEDLFVEHVEVRRQLEFADRVVHAKADLAAHRSDGVREWLAARCPGRVVRDAVEVAVGPDLVLAEADFGEPAAGQRAWLGEVSALQDADGHGEVAHAAYTAHTLRSAAPVDLAALQRWMRLVTQVDGPRLLRIRGLVRCARSGDGFALHAAGRSTSPPRRLARSPPDLRGAEFVLIERGLPCRAVDALLESLRSACAAEFLDD